MVRAANYRDAQLAQVLERRERWRRRLPAGEHALLAELAYAPVEEIGGRPAQVLADRSRICRLDARSRLEEAMDLDPRRALSGQPLPPKLAAPDMCNPRDEQPTITGQPSPEALEGDDRSTAQRTHDALNAGCEILHR